MKRFEKVLDEVSIMYNLVDEYNPCKWILWKYTSCNWSWESSDC
jgi:hypothetical protein